MARCSRCQSRRAPFGGASRQGYVPLNKDRRQPTLERKRQEYRDAVAQYFGPDNTGGPTPLDDAIFHQARIRFRQARSPVHRRRSRRPAGPPEHRTTIAQIHIDVPRTNPDVPLFQSKIVHKVNPPDPRRPAAAAAARALGG